MSIERRIAVLAERFARDVLAELKGTNLDDLVDALATAKPVRRAGADRPAFRLEPRRGAGGRLKRRSPEELQALLDRVVAELGNDALRAEQIQAALGLERKELPAVLNWD
jgi:hypothetical protein